MTAERKLLIATVLVAFGLVAWYRSHVLTPPDPVPTEPARIVVVTAGTGPFWEAAIRGAEAAAAALNATLDVKSPEHNESLEEQESLLDNLDLSKVDGIAMSPLDGVKQAEKIDALVEKVKVVTFDADAPNSNRHSHVGTSNFSAGRVCARLVGEAIPDGGKIAVFLATSTKENLLDRKGGLQEMIGRMADDDEEGQNNPKYQIVEFSEDRGNLDVCVANFQRILAEEPDLRCVVGLNSYQGAALAKAIAAEGKTDAIRVVCFDANEETLAEVEKGTIYATIAQDPYKFGHEAISILVSMCRDDSLAVPIVGRGSTYLGVEPLKKEDVAEFRTRLQTRQTGS
ncbi:MAG: substrate-binding domain-containing protein [Planctomycetales bacterium]|nr:substrate-binding domain-containing protein [Planctomycetales bacterium]